MKTLHCKIPCNLCNSRNFTHLFNINSTRNEKFQVVSCSSCGLKQVNPQPNITAVKPYYSDTYFLKRNERGYDNYYSESVRNEICRVYEKNLSDLNFWKHERGLKKKHKILHSLDLGCAAGYFVELIKKRHWQAEGIDLAKGPVLAARKRGLKIHLGDWFSKSSIQSGKYHLITLWASIEHMHNPYKVFKRSAKLLKADGHLIISTCCYNYLAKLQGKNWRFMNVPEHLYFFNQAQITKMAKKAGFRLISSVSYGSGLTKKKDASYLYKTAKFLADWLVKKLKQGDMMALHFQKIKS